MKECRVGVVVLGDMGRSPRMQYHVQSLASHGFLVDFIGYSGSQLPEQISQNERVTIKYLSQVPGPVSRLPRLLAYVLKTVWQALFLLLSLPLLSHLDFVLVQTPPGVPTIPVLCFYCFIKGTKLVVDFHNYSHTILAMALSNSHPLVKITHDLERMFSRTAHASFCVTKAMKEDLSKNWDISSTRVLYDRPPEKFKPISSQEKVILFNKLSDKYPVLKNFSAKKTGVIVSSTSWTEDEDFGVLLDALIRYDEKAASWDNLPQLLVVITGKGPQKQYYLEKISNLDLKHVSFVTPWLETEDYPKMLASADLGVCLHTSSSGLDLPMKVVDMFGCRLPVAAVEFPALSELVEDGVSGRTFADSSELSDIIINWFLQFPEPQEDHQTFRQNIDKFRKIGWIQNWDSVALDVFSNREIKASNGLPIIFFIIFVLCYISSFLPFVQ